MTSTQITKHSISPDCRVVLAIAEPFPASTIRNPPQRTPPNSRGTCWTMSDARAHLYPLHSSRVTKLPHVHMNLGSPTGVSVSRKRSFSSENKTGVTMRCRGKELLVEMMRGTDVTPMEHHEPREKPADVLPLLQKVHRKQQPWLATLAEMIFPWKSPLV